jgi:hypothetical protein
VTLRVTKRESGSVRCVHPLADEENKGKEKEKLACHGRMGIGGKSGIWRILIAIGKIRKDKGLSGPDVFKNVEEGEKKKKN